MGSARRCHRAPLIALCIGIAAAHGCQDFNRSGNDTRVCYGPSDTHFSGGAEAALAFLAIVAIVGVAAAASEIIHEIGQWFDRNNDPGIRWDSREGLALRLSRPLPGQNENGSSTTGR
jgi:hypothetical protein